MSDRFFKYIAIGVVAFWLFALALLPFIFVLGASFFTAGDVSLFKWPISFSNYTQLFNLVYIHVFLRSFMVAGITTICCLLIGYPFAYIMAKLSERWRLLCLFLIIIPFWTSSLIRTYAVITLIKTQGLLNQLLLSLHVIHTPLHLLYTSFASQVGLIYSLLPYMILPLFAVLEKFDWRLVDAARDLGASKWRAFWQVVVPISMPGIMAGMLLVLLPAMTLFYIPDILGGAKSILLGNVIKSEFLDLHNWPEGSAISVVLTLIMALLIFIYWKLTSKGQRQALL